MNKFKNVLILAGFLAAFPAIQSTADQTGDDNTAYRIQIFEIDESVLPGAQNYQKEWLRLTGFELSGLHWEQFVVVYTNEGDKTYRHNFVQYSAWFDDPEDEDNEPQYRQYPIGTVLIKENYSIAQGKPDKPVSITAMVKQKEGFNSEGGDWEYIQFDHTGKLLLRGSGKDPYVSKTCASCHENVSDRDFIFSNIYSSASQ